MTEVPSLGSADEEYFEHYGGYCLGMVLAARYGEEVGFLIPKQRLLEEVSNSEIAIEFPNGFGIKRSGTDESFSSESLRGVNSSRGYYCNSPEQTEIRTILDKARRELYGHASLRALVLQTYLRGFQISTRSLDGLSQIEHIVGRARFYSEVDHKGGIRTEAFNAHECTKERQQAIRGRLGALSIQLAELREQIGFDLDIELMDCQDGIYITQLRPTAPDDCLEYVDSGPATKLTTRSSHQSMCVNGIWNSNRAYTIGSQETDQEAHVYIKADPDLEKCSEIVKSLKSQRPTLVLDPFSGFKITHEPSNLPRQPEHRRFFACMSVANSLMVIRDGASVAVNIGKQGGVLHEVF